MTYRAPLWARAFLAADRLLNTLDGVRDGVRDEVFLAWIPPAQRGALTGLIYASRVSYLPGGRRFESGLFAWERHALEMACFPRSGRVLVGAAGAGRELAALIERGFDVVAFDPCAPFVDAAREVAARVAAESRRRGTRSDAGDAVEATPAIVCASYDDLVRAASGGGGPLGFLRPGPGGAAHGIDAVLLGWGSLSHVMPAASRADLLAAVRAIAPRAPVLTSFMFDADSGTGKGRVRDTLRRAFARLGAPGASERGDHFVATAGFFSCLDRSEIDSLAAGAGYDVALLEETPYPHAVLVPTQVHGAPRRRPLGA